MLKEQQHAWPTPGSSCHRLGPRSLSCLLPLGRQHLVEAARGRQSSQPCITGSLLVAIHSPHSGRPTDLAPRNALLAVCIAVLQVRESNLRQVRQCRGAARLALSAVWALRMPVTRQTHLHPHEYKLDT